MSFRRTPARDHTAGMTIRELRLLRGWSQDQLAERSGLSVRTVQRLEQGRPPGLATAQALARALDVGVDDVRQPRAGSGPEGAGGPVDAVGTCLRRFADFDGVTSRPQYWWFVLFVVVAGGVGTLLGERGGAVVLLLLLVPLLAAGARRLHDADRSGWWQLLALVPFGAVVPLVLLALPSAVPGRAGPEQGRVG